MKDIDRLKAINRELIKALEANKMPSVVFYKEFSWYLQAITHAICELEYYLNDRLSNEKSDD